MTTVNNATVFAQFAKGGKSVRVKSSNCVIYTRVSTKEQADNNMSLETQKKACESYAEKNAFRILGYFGGTYESAKTDERKHFNNMLTFVKRSKEKISTIIVYSVDRFSRSGANAIYITEQLKRKEFRCLRFLSQQTPLRHPGACSRISSSSSRSTTISFVVKSAWRV
jgi:site-specific DNA recombinase